MMYLNAGIWWTDIDTDAELDRKGRELIQRPFFVA